MRHGRFGILGLGLIIGILSIAPAEAVEISTGPLRVNETNELACIAVNAGATNIATATIRLIVRKIDGTGNGGATTDCGTFFPNETCQATKTGSLNDYSTYCEITYPGGRIRGTLCNVTLGLCSNAE